MMVSWKKVFAMSMLGLTLCSVAQVNLRPEIAKNLQNAQVEMNDKNFDAALKYATSARSFVDLNTQERIMIEKAILVAAINAKDFSLATEAAKYLSHQDTLSNAEQIAYLEILINILGSKSQAYELSIYAKEYLSKGGEKESVRRLYVQSLSMQKMHTEVINFLSEVEHSKNFKPLAEQELQALAIAHKMTKNDEMYMNTLKRLVVTSKNKDYLLGYIEQVKKNKDYNKRYELDLLRLMLAKNLIEDPIDYIYYAQTALQFGFPFEAKSVVQMGNKVNAFNLDLASAKVKELTNEIEKKIKIDEKQILVLERSNNESDFAELAEVYFSKGNYKQAIEKYKQALAAKSVRRETELRLHYLIALAKEADFDLANQVLLSLGSDKTASEIGFLWLRK